MIFLKTNLYCQVGWILLASISKRVVVFSVITLIILSTSCSTPFYSTDNKFLLYLPGTERRSDKLPGYIRPWERLKLIEEKGKKGQKANIEEKDVLLVQLTQEYEQASSPNIKRAALDAISRISVNYANPAAEKIYRMAIDDPDMHINLSAYKALSVYCTEGVVVKNNEEQRKLAAELLATRYKALPYSIAAGAEDENSRRKDERVAILKALANFKPDDSPEVFNILELGLTGEKLDDGALQVTSCSTLTEITGKKYGLDSQAWIQYIAFERGETTSPPTEPTLMERMPKLDTGMFK